MTAAQLRQAIQDVLKDQHVRKACEALQQEMATCNGAEAAVDVLENMVKARRQR